MSTSKWESFICNANRAVTKQVRQITFVRPFLVSLSLWDVLCHLSLRGNNVCKTFLFMAQRVVCGFSAGSSTRAKAERKELLLSESAALLMASR